MPTYRESKIVDLIGTVDGVNDTFTTPSSFFPSTIKVIWNGAVYEASDSERGWSEVNAFTVQTTTPPQVGDELQCFYREQDTSDVLGSLVDVKGSPVSPSDGLCGDPSVAGGAWGCEFQTIQTEVVCDASDAIGNWLYVSGPKQNGLMVMSKADPSDAAKMPAEAILIGKTSDTRGAVVFRGFVLNTVSGLNMNASDLRLYLGADGTTSQTKPADPAETQVLGFAAGERHIFVAPELITSSFYNEAVNPFDQDLNTTDHPTFADLDISGLVSDTGNGPLELGTTGVPSYAASGDIYIGSKLEVADIAYIAGVPFTSNSATNIFLGTTGAAVTGIYNTFFGNGAGTSTKDGQQNLYMGYNAAYHGDSAERNVALGQSALFYNESGTNNVCIGSGAGQGTSGQSYTSSIFIGQIAGYVNYGNNNLGIGANSLAMNTTGTDNIALGYQASQKNQVGTNTIAIGTQALQNNKAGGSTAVGYMAGRNNTDGVSNTYVGGYAGYWNKALGRNTAMGYGALLGANGVDVEDCVALGHQALKIAQGHRNIGIGSYTGDSLTTGTDNILIGQSIEAPSATSSYKLNIGNIVKGDTSAKRVYLAVGTTAPADAELVNGEICAWVDESGNALSFKVKYSSGTVKNGSIALT